MRRRPTAHAPTTKVFNLTAKRWWINIKDDGEDSLPEAVLEIRSARLRRALQRLRKPYNRRRREHRLTCGPSKAVAPVAVPRGRRIRLSKHICMRFWLKRWRKRRRRMIRIKSDRSWAFLLQISRTWKRYLFLRPWFSHWRLAHTFEYCGRRNEFLLKRNRVIASYNRRRLRGVLRFWRLVSRITRACKRHYFVKLRLQTKMPRMVRHLERGLLGAGFQRWRRRSRWPKVAELFARRLHAFLSQWQHSSTVSLALRSSVQRARGVLNGKIIHRWRYHAHVRYFCSSSERLAVQHRQLRCYGRGLSAMRLFLQQGSQSTKSKLASNYFRLRLLFFAWGTLAKKVAILGAQRSANFRGEDHFSKLRRRESLSFWADRAARIRRFSAACASGRGSNITAAFRRLVVRHRCEQFCRRGVASSRQGRVQKLVRTTTVAWSSWAAERRKMNAQMRLAREHSNTRRTPAGLRKWRRLTRRTHMLRHVVNFYVLNIRLAVALGVWGKRKERTIAEMLRIRRGGIRWQVQQSRLAITRFYAWTLRRRVHRRLFSVFRRLHPVPRCSSAAKVFAAWALEYVPCQRRRRVHFKTVRRGCRLRILTFYFEQWDSAFFGTTRGKGGAWSALAGRRALRRWEQTKIKSYAAWALLQKYLDFRGLLRKGGHVVGYAVRTPACVFIVQQSLRQASFPRFCAACKLRRLLRLWRKIAANAARAAIAHNSVVYFAIHRAAALARSAPTSLRCRSRWLLRSCWDQWAAKHSLRVVQKRRLFLICGGRKLIARWRALQQAAAVAKHLKLPERCPIPRPPPKKCRIPNTCPRTPLPPNKYGK